MNEPLFVDVEMGVAPLLTLVRNQIRQFLHPCVKPFTIEGLGTVYVDHIDVPTAVGFTGSSIPFASGFVRRAAVATTNTIAHGWKEMFSGAPHTSMTDVAVHDPEIVVPLRLAIATDFTLAQGLDPVTGDGMVIRIVLALRAEMKRDEVDADGNPKPPFPRMSVKVADVDFGLLDPLMPQWAKDMLRSNVLGKSVPLPVNLTPLKNLLKGYVGLAETNVGITLDVVAASSQHATRIGIRFEVNGPAESLAAWQSYLDGAMGPPLENPNGCRFVIPAGLLTAWSEAMFAAKLEEKAGADDAKFEVLDWPHATWWPGLLQTNFEIDVFVPGCVLDIAVEVNVSTTFQIQSGALKAVSTVKHESSDLDVVVCAVSQGGPELLQAISAGIAADVYEPDLSDQVGLPAKCTWTVDDAEITCTYPISLPIGAIAATISQLQAGVNGLALVGVATVTETEPTKPWFNPSPKLAWPSAGLCGNGDDNELLLATITGGTVCDVKVIDDPLNQFAPFVFWSDKHSVKLRLSVTDIVGGTSPPLIGVSPGQSNKKPMMPDDWYFAHPYPLRVIIRTSDGAKLVQSINVLPMPVKPAELTPLQQSEQEIEKKINCLTWAEWWSDRLFMPRWWPDPPPEAARDGSIYEQIWRVLVSDVDAGREVVITGPQGPLARLISGNGRFAYATLLLRPESAGSPFAVAEDGASGRDAPGGSLRIEQAILEPVASIELPATVSQTALWASSPIRVACLSSVGVFIYELSEPARPQLVDVLDDPGIRGIHGFNAGLLVWGRNGLRILGADRFTERWPLPAQPVFDAVIDQGTLHVLTKDGLVSFAGDVDARRRDAEPTRAWRLAGGDRVRLVAGAASFCRLMANGSEDSLSVPALPLDDIAAIRAADGPARKHEVVLLRRDGGSLRFDMSTPDRPRLTAEIGVDEWATTVRFRDLVTRIAPDGRELHIHRRRMPIQLRRWQLEESRAGAGGSRARLG